MNERKKEIFYIVIHYPPVYGEAEYKTFYNLEDVLEWMQPFEGQKFMVCKAEVLLDRS